LVTGWAWEAASHPFYHVIPATVKYFRSPVIILIQKEWQKNSLSVGQHCECSISYQPSEREWIREPQLRRQSHGLLLESGAGRICTQVSMTPKTVFCCPGGISPKWSPWDWLFFYFGGTGVWTLGLPLAMQALCYLNHTASPFGFKLLSLLFIYFFWCDWSLNSWVHACKCRCSIACATPLVFFSGYFGDGGQISWTICLGWSWTLILPITASQVARIVARHELLTPGFSLFF
jgi:hypothetical protein